LDVPKVWYFDLLGVKMPPADQGLIQMEKDVQEIKVQVELVKKDIQQFQKVVDKLDTTNDKIQELIANISRITTLHEQKISESERNSKYVWEELDDIKKRVETLERFKWIAFGIISFISMIVPLVISLLDLLKK
jgi:septal ring factor EnvC (AmiA/AmiB activator)